MYASACCQIFYTINIIPSIWERERDGKKEKNTVKWKWTLFLVNNILWISFLFHDNCLNSNVNFNGEIQLTYSCKLNALQINVQCLIYIICFSFYLLTFAIIVKFPSSIFVSHVSGEPSSLRWCLQFHSIDAVFISTRMWVRVCINECPRLRIQHKKIVITWAAIYIRAKSYP